ncbi:DASH complex subunit ask1 [Thecaphora frezii]
MYGQPRQSPYPGANPMPMAASTASAGPSSAAAVPLSTQLMQLDHEITSTLQEIDQNFTTAHQIITSRILPAIDRYGVASARSWQGAKFWKQFFENSADVSLSSRGAYEDDYDNEYNDNEASSTYEQSTTQDGESEAQSSFVSDSYAASPRSVAGTDLYDESRDHSVAHPAHAHPHHRGTARTAEPAGDDTAQSNTFYSNLDGPRTSSPPRFSNASMAAAARREADKKKHNDQSRHLDDASLSPIESPFERLRKDLTQDISRLDDSANESAVQAHQRERELTTKGRADADKVYYDDATNDETIEVDRSALAQDVENLDISASRGYGYSSIAPPPELSRPIHATSPASSARKKPSGTPRARGPLLNKVLNSEQRKRDGVHGGRKARESLPRFDVTPRGGLSVQNPFAQPASIKMWDGIVDLRKTPLNSKAQRGGASRAKGSASGSRTKTEAGKPGARRGGGGKGKEDNSASEWDSEEENDSFGWPEGMSPPVTMQFSVPQSKYAKTPAKEAARLMVEDLLKSVGASRPVGQANIRTALSHSTGDTSDKSDGGGGGGYRGSALVPGSSESRRAGGVVRTPLQRSKKESRALDRAAAAAGSHRRRDSMPTPPTLTKKGPAISAPKAAAGGAASRPRMSTTPEVTPQAGSFSGAASGGSLLRRGPPGAGVGGGEGSGGMNSAASMLMDEDEGLDGGYAASAGGRGEQEEEEEVPANLGTKLSAVALQSHPGPAAAAGVATMHLVGEDEDSSEDESLDSDEEEEEDIPPPPSAKGRDTSNTWTGSTVASSTASRVGARSIEDDTLFGVPNRPPPPPAATGGREGLRNPFSRLDPAPEAGAREGGERGTEGDFKVWGHVDEMGTVHGGRPLVDRDDTYSAPSPTPMHFAPASSRR